MQNMHGLYMLPGGSIEEGEKEEKALIRELKEEIGDEDIKFEKQPFLKIERYNKYYYTRKFDRNVNKLTITKVYEGFLEKDEISKGIQNLTQEEKGKGFELEFVNISKIKYLIETNKTDNIKKDEFSKELLCILREFKYYKEKKEKSDKTK